MRTKKNLEGNIKVIFRKRYGEKKKKRKEPPSKIYATNGGLKLQEFERVLRGVYALADA